MAAAHTIGLPPSNAQPEAARSSFWMPPNLLGYDDTQAPAGHRHSSTTQCDAACSPDALMWLLAQQAAPLQSGVEKS